MTNWKTIGTPKRTEALAGAGVLLLFGWELLRPGATFYRWDTWIYLWPLLQNMKMQWLNGIPPFRIQEVAAGTALLGNINAAALYPLRWIHFLLPLPLGYNLFVLTHLGLSLFFFRLWLRKGLEMRVSAAWVGAMLYTFSGYARGMWDTHNFTVLPWIPLWLLALSRPANGKRKTSLMLAVCAWCLMVLSGDIQQTLLAGLAGGALCLALPDSRGRLRVWGLAVVIGSLLSAPQLLSTWEVARESYRSAGMPWAEAVERSFHPIRLFEWVVPHLFGTHETWFAPRLFGEGATSRMPWTASIHLAPAALLCASLGLRRSDRRLTGFGLALLVVSLALSMGRFLPGFSLWQSLPLIQGFRFPEKYLLWTTVAVALLAARGIDGPAFPSLVKRSSLRGALAFVLILGLLLFAARHAAHLQGVPEGWLTRQLLMGLGLGLLALPLFLLHEKRSQWIVWCVMLQLLMPWFIEKPLSHRLNVREAPPLARLIHQSPVPHGRFFLDPAVRTIPLPSYWHSLKRESERRASYYASSLRFNAGALWGVRSASGFSPLEQASFHRFRTESAWPMDGTVVDAEQLADFLKQTGTRWLLTTPARRAELDALGVYSELHQRWQAEEGLSEWVFLSGTAETQPEDVAWSRPRDGEIDVDLNDFSGSELIVAESWSAGWRAAPSTIRLSETPQGTIRMQGLDGLSQASLFYEQPGWRTGWVCSGFGVLLLLGLVLRSPRGKEKPGEIS